MEELFGEHSHVVQLSLWIVAGLLSITVGPICWRQYKVHVDQLQEMIEDLENDLARVREERDKLRDSVIAYRTADDLRASRSAGLFDRPD